MNSGKSQSKVIISATCFADADAAIKMATKLAKKINRDLHGLLIEDESILRYADLPFAKVIAFQSGMPQQVTPEAMASAFRSDAKLFKTILAKTAVKASVNWSFESKRGQMMPLLHSITSKGDLILFGYQQSQMLSGRILYLNFSNTDNSEYRELASQIASEMNMPFEFISFRNSLKPDANSTTTVENEDQVLELLHKTNLRAVFVAADDEHNFDINKFLEAARCPIIYLVQE